MHRFGTIILTILLVATFGCSNDTSDGGGSSDDARTGTMSDATGGAFECITHRDCRAEFDDRPVCDLDAAEEGGRCTYCSNSDECPGMTVCWTGGGNPSCVTNCTNDSSKCENRETCTVVNVNSGKKGCVPH